MTNCTLAETADSATPHIPTRSTRAAECPFRAEGLCDLTEPSPSRCERCERYADLLRSARELYGGVRWTVNAEGMLVELET